MAKHIPVRTMADVAVTLLAALFGVGMMSAAHASRIQRSDILEIVKLFVHGAAPRKGL